MIDHEQISETNEKVLRAILEDDNDTVNGITQVIKSVWGEGAISEFIFQLLDRDEKLIKIIQEWNLEAMKKE